MITLSLTLVFSVLVTMVQFLMLALVCRADLSLVLESYQTRQAFVFPLAPLPRSQTQYIRTPKPQALEWLTSVLDLDVGGLEAEVREAEDLVGVVFELDPAIGVVVAVLSPPDLATH